MHEFETMSAILRYNHNLWMEKKERILLITKFRLGNKIGIKNMLAKKSTTAVVLDQASTETNNALGEIVREGARRLLQHAIEVAMAWFSVKCAIQPHELGKNPILIFVSPHKLYDKSPLSKK